MSRKSRKKGAGKKSRRMLLAAMFTLWLSSPAQADPTRYPQFAQQEVPQGLVPEFIHLDQFVDEIVQGKKPLIIDVRSRDEYDEAHIKGSISIPLNEIPLHLGAIPKDRPVVFY